jgi:phytoene dehydrogenase-like protein
MENKTKTVSIVWWGIGWLASAILLAKQWYKVSVYEKNECLGGRASILYKDGYTFDMGPSRYLMPDIFEEYFESIGENVHEYLDLKQLSPSYRVFYESSPPTPLLQRGELKHLDVYADPKRMSDIFESMEKWAGKQFLTFLDRAKIQYEIGMEFCKKNYDSIFDFFRRDIMWKGIKLNIRTTIDHYVARFFKNQLIRKIMQYTTVFLGTAPKQTPALYNIMSHCDFNMWVRYPKWGIHQIARVLHQIGLKHGVEYYLNTEVVGCEIKNNQIQSLQIKQKQKENIIILHGFTWLPTVNFIPWLKKKLEDLWHKVEAPFLPNIDAPNILEQIEYVKNNCTINEDTIIVWHSLGSVVAQKIAEWQKIKGLLLVWSYADLDFIDGEWEDRVYAKTFDWKFDFEKIQSHCERMDILHDQNDDTIWIWQFEKIASNYWVGKVVIGNDQHFCGDEEPEIRKSLESNLGINRTQSDIYLINADMAWFETSVLPSDYQSCPKTYRDKKIFAPSGFIIYAGINKKLPNLDHHNLYFCEDRDKNFGQIFDTKELPDRPSIYVSKITHTDLSMAPEWCENLFILVPIPNGIEITDNQKEQYKNMVRTTVEQMTGEDIVWHVVVEELFSIADFKSRYNSRQWTALWLAHPIMQTAVFRPNNISKKLDNLFYVWHNTNPGIGVPMVIISAKLALERIMKQFKI